MQETFSTPSSRSQEDPYYQRSPRYDLVDMAQALQRRSRFLLIVTLLAAVVGALVYFLSPRNYKATTEVFVANPLYADRNHIFPTGQTHLIDYFANEEIVDKAMVVGLSSKARNEVLRRQNLAKEYKIDASTRLGQNKLAGRYKKNYEIKRTEYGNLEISYTDTHAGRAANVANEAAKVLGDIYHEFYSSKRRLLVEALEQKSREADSAIAVLTDSLAAMRERYGIYEILSPNRATSIISSNTGSRSGRGVEEIQNIESLKDQWVIDRARALGIINEMSTGIAADQTPIVHVLSEAVPPIAPAGLGFLLTVVACTLVGFFFAALWILLSTYFAKLTAVKRAN